MPTINERVCAVAAQQPDNLITFIESNNIAINSVDVSTMETPLGYCVKINNIAAAKALLDVGANPNTPGFCEHEGRRLTPLHMAQDGPMTKLLLDYGASVTELDSNFADPIASTIAHLIHFTRDDDAYWSKLDALLDWIADNNNAMLFTYAEVFLTGYSDYIKQLVWSDLERSPNAIHELAIQFIDDKQDEYHRGDYSDDLCSDDI